MCIRDRLYVGNATNKKLYSMGIRTIGDLAKSDETLLDVYKRQNQYLGGDTSLSCSADTQKEIDEKVVQLVKAEHEKARKILAENREKLDELAMYLYEKETITGDEFMDILDIK